MATRDVIGHGAPSHPEPDVRADRHISFSSSPCHSLATSKGPGATVTASTVGGSSSTARASCNGTGLAGCNHDAGLRVSLANPSPFSLPVGTNDLYSLRV